MIPKNIYVSEGLVNDTQGIVEDFWSAPKKVIILTTFLKRKKLCLEPQ
jgi:hypothetical protein